MLNFLPKFQFWAVCMFRQIIECAKTKGTGITAIFELEKVGGKSLGLRIFGNILDMVVTDGWNVATGLIWVKIELI